MATKSLTKATKEVYRGYMPIDLPQNRPRNPFKVWWKVLGKPRVTLYPKKEIEGYSEQPEYPPIATTDATTKGLKHQGRLDWYDSLKSLPTSQQKLHEIGRHCEHNVALINNWMPTYDSLPMTQYLTQTHLIANLPEGYINNLNKSDRDLDTNDNSIDLIKQALLAQIALDKYELRKESPKYVSKSIRDGNMSAHVSNSLIRNMVACLKSAIPSERNSELLNYKVDLSPSIRSWWYHSGFKPPSNRVFFKSRKDANGNINQIVQMDGSTALNFRSDSLIEPILSITDPLVTDTSLVPEFNYPLRHYGAKYKFKNPVALPGFWFEDKPKFDCPHTAFISMDCLKVRNSKTHELTRGTEDDENCLTGQAILSAFGWLNSLSMYHGFTPFQELTYPLTCQTVTTDGQSWLFNVYQMNSHTFHRDLDGPKRNNICWSSGKMQLYEGYENGLFHGVNDDVIALIVRFLSQKTSPEYTAQMNIRNHLADPNLTDEEMAKVSCELRRQFEQRRNRWLLAQWKVPLYEHLFFRSKENRNRITFMKPRWHIPKPKYPKIFE